MSLLVLWMAAVPALDVAEKALKDFDAKAALTAVHHARSQGPLSLPDHIRIYEYTGIAHAYLGHKQESLKAFSTLLMLSPGHAIAYTLSPQVTFLFQEARKNAGPRPQLDFSWPRDRTIDQPLPIVVEVLKDPMANLAYAKLFWRDAPGSPYTSLRVDLPKPGSFITVDTPAVPSRTSDLSRQLYLSAFDAQGNEISRLGAPRSPREVMLRYIEPTPWYQRWWIWASVGAAVAAASATAVYLGTRAQPENIPVSVMVDRSSL